MNRVIIRGLLGAAAGIAMVSGAQAADMPVKAKPVEYVKICSAYGAGFYYIPGTDICLRVGGYVYYEFGAKGTSAVANIYGTNSGVSGSTGDVAAQSGAITAINAGNNYYNSRTSAKLILDARQNTAYGTLRATMSIGPTNANHSTGAGMDYAYIQFAGFTWGYTNSFYSFGGAYSVVANPALDWAWINTFAYTAQLGNGVTASIAFEDPSGRRAGYLSSADSTPSGACTTTCVGENNYGGRWMPDIVGNINVTQAWGRAQIMGAIHEVKRNNGNAGLGASTEYGWAVGAGIEVKTPQTGNANNSFLLQGTMTEGAVDYTGYNSSPTAATHVMSLRNMTNTAGPLYTVHDAYFNAGTGEVRLTEAWSVYAAYRHYWTPMLRTGFFAGWLNVETGANVANASNLGDLEVLQAGVSTIWSPVAGLDLSLDVIYSDLEQSNAFTPALNGSRDLWTVWSRLRRNF